MNQLMTKAMFTLAFSLLVSTSWAQINVTGVRYAGAGCPQGSAQISFSPGNSAFSILFGGPMNISSADSPSPESNASYGYADCTIDLDISIPVGQQLELASVDYRGFMSLPSSQTYGRIISTHYIRGGTVDTPNRRRDWGSRYIGGVTMSKQGPLDSDVFFRANYGFGVSPGKLYSRCSGSANIRIKVEAATHTFDVSQNTLVTMDSADGSFAADYGIALRPCDAENRRLDKICKRGSCPQD